MRRAAPFGCTAVWRTGGRKALRGDGCGRAGALPVLPRLWQGMKTDRTGRNQWVDMANELTLFHCGDLHLGAPGVTGVSLLEPLERVVDFCLRSGVDCLLIAGDCLESALLTDADCRDIGLVLKRMGATPVLIVTGNHDPLLPGSGWARICETAPVTVAGGIERAVWSERGVRFWLTGFDAEHVPESRLSCPGLERRAADRRRGETWLDIGLAHGDLGQPSSLYNPLSVRQIAASGLDYLALGHVHRPSPRIEMAGGTAYAYCGAAEGRHFGETGPKGGWLVRVEPGRTPAVTGRFIELMPFPLLAERVTVDLSDGLFRSPEQQAAGLSEQVAAVLSKRIGRSARRHFYRLTLVHPAGVRPPASLSDALLASLRAQSWQVDRLVFQAAEPAALPEAAALHRGELSLRGCFVRSVDRALAALKADSQGPAAGTPAETGAGAAGGSAGAGESDEAAVLERALALGLAALSGGALPSMPEAADGDE